MVVENESGRSTKIPISIVSINGRYFVSGLFWQSLTRPRGYMREAREIGRRENMDIVTIRHGTIIQAGFVSKKQGVVKGMYSLASSLASQLGDSWLGVFEIDANADQFALIAVHDGAVMPGCDMIGDRNEINDKLRIVYNYSAWSKIYAPSSFEFGGEQLDIRTLLQPKSLKKGNQLQPLKFNLSPKEVALLVSVLVLVVGNIIGYVQWENYLERLRREALIRAEQARLAALNAGAKGEQGQRVFDHPWARQPSVDDFVRECTDAIYSLRLFVGGWSFREAKCDGRTVLAHYTRQATSQSR